TRSQEISERMHRTDKLAAMGSLAACLAHEIRNPLGAIRGLAQLLGEGLAPGDARRSYTDTMIREIDRLDEVVTNLREFTQTSPDKAGPCRINDLVEQALLLARVEGDADRPILEKRLDPNLPLVQGEGRKLVQALLNLMLNATQAVEPAGSIRVSTTRVAPGAGVNGRVRVSVANSGPLPDPSVQARMFDPFFTTKKDGTGLGLAIASQIAHAHQGRLFSVHRDGLMTFCLDLPVSPDPALPQS
ncbi:MAG: nitrogen regulation protein NR(II), partial [Nitrospinaceae bacterium]